MGKHGEQALFLFFCNPGLCLGQKLSPSHCSWYFLHLSGFYQDLELSHCIFPNLFTLCSFLIYLLLKCLLYCDAHLFPSPYPTPPLSCLPPGLAPCQVENGRPHSLLFWLRDTKSHTVSGTHHISCWAELSS